MNQEEKAKGLRELIRDQVDCGCCHIELFAIERVARYFEYMYGDEPLEVLGSDRYTNLMTDMYYLVCFDRDYQIYPLEEPRRINARHKRETK